METIDNKETTSATEPIKIIVEPTTATKKRRRRTTTTAPKVEVAQPIDPSAAKRKWDKEMVTGVFKFYEQRGGVFKFFHRLPYKGEKIEHYTLVDGQSATIPRGVARHLRDGGKVPVHAHLYDPNGKPTQRVGELVDRFDFFESNSFEEPKPYSNIITV